MTMAAVIANAAVWIAAMTFTALRPPRSKRAMTVILVVPLAVFAWAIAVTA